MTIERGEVERLLHGLCMFEGQNTLVAELCRTWLAVQDAPVVEWYGYESDLPQLPAGQRVRLVPVGGER